MLKEKTKFYIEITLSSFQISSEIPNIKDFNYKLSTEIPSLLKKSEEIRSNTLIF